MSHFTNTLQGKDSYTLQMNWTVDFQWENELDCRLSTEKITYMLEYLKREREKKLFTHTLRGKDSHMLQMNWNVDFQWEKLSTCLNITREKKT